MRFKLALTFLMISCAHTQEWSKIRTLKKVTEYVLTIPESNLDQIDVVADEFKGEDGQLWKYDDEENTITSKSGRLLDIKSLAVATKTDVVAVEANDQVSSKTWEYDGAGTVKNTALVDSRAAADNILTVNELDTAGSSIHLTKAVTDGTQFFYFEPVTLCGEKANTECIQCECSGDNVGQMDCPNGQICCESTTPDEHYPLCGRYPGLCKTCDCDTTNMVEDLYGCETDTVCCENTQPPTPTPNPDRKCEKDGGYCTICACDDINQNLGKTLCQKESEVCCKGAATGNIFTDGMSGDDCLAIETAKCVECSCTSGDETGVYVKGHGCPKDTVCCFTDVPTTSSTSSTGSTSATTATTPNPTTPNTDSTVSSTSTQSSTTTEPHPVCDNFVEGTCLLVPSECTDDNNFGQADCPDNMICCKNQQVADTAEEVRLNVTTAKKGEKSGSAPRCEEVNDAACISNSHCDDMYTIDQIDCGRFQGCCKDKENGLFGLGGGKCTDLDGGHCITYCTDDNAVLGQLNCQAGQTCCIGKGDPVAEVYGPDCKSQYMWDKDGPGGEPAVEVPCPTKKPVFVKTSNVPDENCFGAQDDVAKKCFGHVKFSCSARGYYGACSSYHYCTPDGSGGYNDKEYHCPAGQVFSDSHKTCLNINKVPECYSWGGCPVEEGFYRDPQNCRKFYYCAWSPSKRRAEDNAATLICPTGMFFSTTEENCVPWREADKCAFSLDAGTYDPSINKLCSRAGVIPDPTDAASTRFLVCFPITGTSITGTYGAAAGDCHDISEESYFNPSSMSCQLNIL